MGNQCGSCAGAPEEGEMNMKVDTQVRKTQSAHKDKKKTVEFDAS